MERMSCQTRREMMMAMIVAILATEETDSSATGECEGETFCLVAEKMTGEVEENAQE